MVIFSSVFGGGNIFGYDNDSLNKKDGKVLGVNEEFDESINQVLIIKKEELENKVVDVIDGIKNDYETKIYDFKDISRLPNNNHRSDGPHPIDDYNEIIVDSNISCVVDVETGKVVYNKNNNTKVPIASISKLMTTLVFLDYNPGWEEVYIIQDSDRRDGGKIFLYLGDKVTVKDLFNMSLVGSANTATIALVHSTGMSEEEFVQKMNTKAMELGLLDTSFKDVTGLSKNNVSTALEVAQIAKYALSKIEINRATLKSEYFFKTLQGTTKKVYTTDYLLENFPENGIKVLGGKTGYTELAEYCFVGKFTNKNGNEIITVVLGSDTKNSRFYETKELAEWTYNNYEWN
jgi:D-alanyl-D-alanine carboxypeptidase (penicillin-binding protein 5/6)